MRSVTVEVATLADAITKAARIAPNKGEAWDKAAGILLEVRPGTNVPLRVKATDLEVTYFQKVATVDAGDEDCDWRLNSGIISGLVSSLPSEVGKHVTLTEDKGIVTVKCGRSKTKLRTYVGAFPKIRPFKPDDLVSVASFARRVQQVAWAVANDHPPLTGVHINGEKLVACDRYKVATVPCVVPVDVPITAPLATLTSVLRNVDDVKLRATDRRLEMMPDSDTQLTCVIFQQTYPNVMGIVDGTDTPHKVTVPKDALVTAIERMLVMVKGERYPKMKVTLGKGTCEFDLSIVDVGDMEDAVDVEGGPDDPIEYWFSPLMILGAVRNSSRDAVTLEFGNDPLRAVHAFDGSGFDAWLMPIRGDQEAQAA